MSPGSGASRSERTGATSPTFGVTCKTEGLDEKSPGLFFAEAHFVARAQRRIYGKIRF